MDVFFQQYFDLDIMRDNFSYVLDGFWLTIQLVARERGVWRWSGGWCWRCCAPRPDARCCRCAGSRSPTST